ncbi:hypothetical protein QCA50_015509 [Cerrena zonata]|uniref:Uncharacterized protein n=1 Tax=Cerrena zonata TaxID=2478898 RepID=A0AAW0FVV0_9APHY
MIPITAFSMAVTPAAELTRLIHSIGWTYLHLLQFNVSNQCLSIEEDIRNKPDRPLAVNRITIKSARILRWILLLLCLAQSIYYSWTMFWVSIILSSAFILYNECGGHEIHWSSRNIMNAFGLSMFEAGATLIVSGNSDRLTPLAFLSIIMSGLVYLTTFHAQDFKDVDGDRLIGRSTLPILFPHVARLSMFVGMFAWSILLPLFWQLDWVISIVFTALGLFVGARFASHRAAVMEDQISFYWYNGWISFVHILPAYYIHVHMG